MKSIKISSEFSLHTHAAELVAGGHNGFYGDAEFRVFVKGNTCCQGNTEHVVEVDQGGFVVGEYLLKLEQMRFC